MSETTHTEEQDFDLDTDDVENEEADDNSADHDDSDQDSPNPTKFSRRENKRISKWTAKAVDAKGELIASEILKLSKDPYYAKSLDSFAQSHGFEDGDDLLEQSMQNVPDSVKDLGDSKEADVIKRLEALEHMNQTVSEEMESQAVEADVEAFTKWKTENIEETTDWEANWESEFEDLLEDFTSHGYSLEKAGKLALASINSKRGDIDPGMKSPGKTSKTSKKGATRLIAREKFLKLPQDRRVAYMKSNTKDDIVQFSD